MQTPRAARLGTAIAALLSAVLGLLPAGAASSTPPESLSYQGHLVDANGIPLGNTTPRNYDVIFRIYDASQGGNLVWAEQQTVTVDQGLFSVLLGEGSAVGSEPRPSLPEVFAGPTASDRFVGITVKGLGASDVEIVPRLRLLTAPYSFLAHNAANLVQPNGSPVVSYSGGLVNIVGAVNASGNISASQFIGNGSQLTGFTQGQIPNLDAGKITSGVFNDGRIPGNLTGNRSFTGGNLGIGTPTPSYRLHVVDATLPSAVFESSHQFGTWLSLGNSSAGGRYWQMISTGSGNGEGAGNFLLGNGTAAGSSAIRMTVQAGGNVGIGTTSPGRRLQIGDGGIGNSEGMIRLSSRSGTGSAFRTWDLGVPENDEIITGTAYSFIIDDTQLGGTEFMVQWGTGNVGIGTTTPTGAKLDVEGSIRVNDNDLFLRGGTDPNHGLGYYGGGKTFAGQSPDGPVLYGFSSGILGTLQNGTARAVARWDNSGLHVNTPSGQTAEIINSWIRIFHATDKGKYVDIDRINNGVRIWATGGGFGNSGDFTRQIVWDGDGNWDSSSDRKLKKNIEDAEPVLDRVLQVQLRRFNWKNEPEDAKKTMGVIAQELQPLFPDMVGETEDKETNEKHLTVGYSDFGMIAVKAIQELKQRHDAELTSLRTQLADLARENERLQARNQENDSRLAALEKLLRDPQAQAAALRASAGDDNKETASVRQ